MLNNVKITEIDLDFLKNYLKIDFEDDDILLFTMLMASKSYIQSYLNRDFDDFEVVPLEFTIACLALVAHWYEKREIQSEKSTKEELKFVFSGLLDIHRNWNAVATEPNTITETPKDAEVIEEVTEEVVEVETPTETESNETITPNEVI